MGCAGPKLGLAPHRPHPDDEAKEVVQDTWLRALTAVYRYRGESGLSTWLIAINEALRRADRRRATVELDPIVDLLPMVKDAWPHRRAQSLPVGFPTTTQKAAHWQPSARRYHGLIQINDPARPVSILWPPTQGAWADAAKETTPSCQKMQLQRRERPKVHSLCEPRPPVWVGGLLEVRKNCLRDLFSTQSLNKR